MNMSTKEGTSTLVIVMAVFGLVVLALLAAVSSRLIWGGDPKPDRLLFLAPESELECAQTVVEELEVTYPELLTLSDATAERLTGTLDEELTLVVVENSDGETEAAVRALSAWRKVDSSAGHDVFAARDMTPVESDFAEFHLERCT